MHLNDREKEILGEFLEYTGKVHVRGLPTIAEFLQEGYFQEHRCLNVFVWKHKRILYLDVNLSQEDRYYELRDFQEMLFLFKKLEEKRYIYIDSLSEEYFSNNRAVLLSSNFDKAVFNNSKNRIEFPDKQWCIESEGYAFNDFKGKTLFTPVFLGSQMDEILKTIILAGAVVSQDLIDYVNNGFRTPEEKYARQTLFATWAGVAVAIGLAILSIVWKRT